MSDKETFVPFTKVDEELGLIIGFAIVCKVNGEPFFDSQGDHVPEDAMLVASTDFMKHSREARTMHGQEKTGSVVYAFPLTTEIAKALEIETNKTGLLIGMMPDDPGDLEKARSGEYQGFSIGGRYLVNEDVS